MNFVSLFPRLEVMDLIQCDKEKNGPSCYSKAKRVCQLKNGDNEENMDYINCMLDELASR